MLIACIGYQVRRPAIFKARLDHFLNEVVAPVLVPRLLISLLCNVHAMAIKAYTRSLLPLASVVLHALTNHRQSAIMVQPFGAQYTPTLCVSLPMSIRNKCTQLRS